MKRNMLIAAALAAAAGAYAWTRPHNAPPADLRDAVGDDPAFVSFQGVKQNPVPVSKSEIVSSARDNTSRRVVCDIEEVQPNGRHPKLDQLVLGQDGVSVVQERGKLISGTQGLGIHGFLNPGGMLLLRLLTPREGWNYDAPEKLYAQIYGSIDTPLEVYVPEAKLRVICKRQ